MSPRPDPDDFAHRQVELAHHLGGAYTAALIAELERRRDLDDHDDRLLAAEADALRRDRPPPRPGKRGRAGAWLLQVLADGPMAEKELRACAPFSERTLERAKVDVGDISDRGAGAWFWCLPNTAKTAKRIGTPE